MLTAIATSLFFMTGNIVAALPKRIFIIANLLILSRVALGFPLNSWLDTSLACRIASAAFFLHALMYLYHAVLGAKWLTQRPWFWRKHSVIAVTAWVVMGLITLPVWILGYANGAQRLMGKYVEISTHGIDLTEKVFTKDGRDVHLVGMMHIGDDSYYKGLQNRINAPPPDGGRRLVLTEGVSDRHKVIPADFANGKTYGRWAKLLGVEAQKSFNNETSPTTPAALEVVSNPLVTWQAADIDVSDLKPTHLKLLVKLLELASSPDLTKMMGADMGSITGAEIESLFKEGLIVTRNDALMKHYTELAPSFQEIYIPWGAAHLPDIESRLLAQGYRITDEVSRPIVKFWD